MTARFLMRHYVLESVGTETRAASFMKFFGRERYYQKMGERLKDPVLATRLELIDRRAKEARLVCPFDPGNSFRKFLIDGTHDDLNDRIRLMQQIAVQLRIARRKFQLYAFSAKDKLAGELVGISRAVGAMQPGVPERFEAVVRCVLDVKRYLLPIVQNPFVPEPDVPVLTCKDMYVYLSANPGRIPRVNWDDLVMRVRSFNDRI